MRNNNIIKYSDANLSIIASFLRDKKLVAIPTETVYGLAGRADSNEAIKKIFTIKKRPFFNPLIIHYKNKESALRSIIHDNRAVKLAEMFWPGPLTIIAKRKKNCKISNMACANLNTVAVRVPSHKALNKLFRIINFPLAAPSANRFGRISPTSALDVDEELGSKLKYILDGGPSFIGIESTIIDLSTDKNIILRLGGENLTNIEKVLGTIILPNSKKIISSGVLKKHYQPNTPIRLNARKPKIDEAWLGFSYLPTDFKGPSLLLTKNKNFSEAAKNLYAMLRSLDHKGVKKIAIECIPNIGLGKAINDRLNKAAAK